LTAEIVLKDSISSAGKSNEIRVMLKDLSGEVQKKTTLRYQLMNGKEISENGKLKTNASGNVIIPFTLPGKTNGEPFICELSDNKGDWKREIYLPSNLDSVFVRFFPEEGNLLPGTVSKIGFTAFNKLGIPVDVEGTIQNQEGKVIATVQTKNEGQNPAVRRKQQATCREFFGCGFRPVLAGEKAIHNRKSAPGFRT
jgi:hypothetical protein